MKHLARHIRSNAVAYLALFIACGGTSMAAINLPFGSVGTRQLRNGAVTPNKLSASRIGAVVRYFAVVDGQGRVLASRPRIRVAGFRGFGNGVIRFGRPTDRRRCFPLGDIDSNGSSQAVSGTFQLVNNGGDVTVTTFDKAGMATPATVSVAVLCSTNN